MIRGGAVVLGVRDVGSAVRFYVETLGMKLVEEGPTSAVIDAGDGFHIALEPREGRSGGGAPGTGEVRLYPKIALEEAVAIYGNRGVSFTTERSSGGAAARFQDPDGNALCLVEHVEPGT